MNLYSEAAQFIDVSGKGGSIRSIIYNAYEKNKGKLKCEPKRVCALVIETLKYRSILEELIKNSQLLKFEKKVLYCNRIFMGRYTNTAVETPDRIADGARPFTVKGRPDSSRPSSSERCGASTQDAPKGRARQIQTKARRSGFIGDHCGRREYVVICGF
jgi:hypothetical protein